MGFVRNDGSQVESSLLSLTAYLGVERILDRLVE